MSGGRWALVVIVGLGAAWWWSARRKAEVEAGKRAPSKSAPAAPKSSPTLDTSAGTGSGASIYTPPEEILGSGFGELSTGAW